MKKCPYCGKEYPDTATICEIDAQLLAQISPPSSGSPFPPSFTGDPQQVIDNEHLKLLSIFHYVVAGLALLGILFLFAHFLIMSAVFTNPEIWKSSKTQSAPPPQFFMAFLGCFYLIMGVIIAAAAVLNFLSAGFLRQRKHRIFSFVVAGLNCLQVPFGTILGVFTFVVLTRNSVRANYSD
jgi:ABC-type phosphate transport system permease subunit